MIIKKRTTALAVGAALSLTLAAAVHAQDDSEEGVSTDPTVMEGAEETALTAEEAEAALEEAGDDAEAMADDAADEAEDAAMAAEEEAGDAAMAAEEEVEDAAAAVMDAADDDEMAAKLQEMITADPELASYGLDVIEMDGRYSITGMIDDSEHYAELERMIGEVDGLDPSMVDNNVVQQ